MQTRPAGPSDAAVIAAIYNQGIEDRIATFETNLKTPEGIAEAIGDWLCCVVGERNGEVIGFAKADPYEDRSHYYEGIGEATIYVTREARRTGAGAALLASLVEAAKERGLHKLTAKVFAANEGSLAMFEKGGFRAVGTHERHGTLDDEWLDVVVLERSL